MVNSVMAGYAEALALRRRPFGGPATAASHN
jgi:hypothetical protein